MGFNGAFSGGGGGGGAPGPQGPQGPTGPEGPQGDSLWQSTGGSTQLVAPQAVLINTNAVNTTAILTLQNAAGDAKIFRVDANPEGVVTGSIGDVADDTTNGVIYVKTSGSATNTGWSPLANLGTKTYMVVEGGQYATIQAAIDATPTGTNTVPAYSVILVGPKANTGGGASGTWGPAVLAANKSLMIVGLGGGQTNKNTRIDSLTFDSSAAGLNANLNENYVSGLYITSSSASSIVTLSGTGAIRLRLNNCYLVNSGAGDAVTNSNTSANGSLYLDTCIVSAESATGIAVRHSGTYTAIRNRCDISTSAGGTSASTGRSLSASAGVVEVYDSTVGGASVPRPAVELTGTAYLGAGYTTIGNTSNDSAARCVFANSATAVFAAGDASLQLGSSVAVAGQVVSGAGTFVYGNITFSYSPLLTVSTQTPALRTGGWFTTAIQEGISLTSPGNPLFNLNSSGRITRYNDAAPTNGQVLIGDTSAGYLKAATLTAGSNVTVTNGPGSVTISSTGAGVPAGGTAGQYLRKTSITDYATEWATASQTRTDIGLGTAATANTGTTFGTIPVLDGSGRLPAVDGSQLTGIASTQVSGLGTAAAATLGTSANNVPQLDGSGVLPLVAYAPETWTNRWRASDGDPTSNGFSQAGTQSITIASTTQAGVACYSLTPPVASGTAYIQAAWTASTTSWEVYAKVWIPDSATASGQRLCLSYSPAATASGSKRIEIGFSSTACLIFGGTNMSSIVTCPDFTDQWIDLLVQCYQSADGAANSWWRISVGRLVIYSGPPPGTLAGTAGAGAGAFYIGRISASAQVTPFYVADLAIRTALNAAPPEYRFGASGWPL